MAAVDRKLLERIWKAVAAIPRGQVASYGEIARRAGMPRRARLVGHALKVAPASLKLPWHRVLNAQGRISLPAGSRAHRQQRECWSAKGIASTAAGSILPVRVAHRISTSCCGVRAGTDTIGAAK